MTNDGAQARSWAGLVAGVGGLALGGLALVRSRNQGSRNPGSRPGTGGEAAPVRVSAPKE